MDDKLKKVYHMICKELDEIGEKEKLSAGDVDVLQKLMSAKKNILLVDQMDTGDYSNAYDGRGGYSNRYYRDYERDSSYHDGYGGGSYAGRDEHYVRGHYSRDEAERGLTQKLQEMSQDTNLPERYRMVAKKALDVMR